jgi:uncharacterized membrane protein
VFHLYRDNRIFVAWDDGARQQHFPTTEPILPAWNGEVYETQSETHRLRVEIRRTTCRDETTPAETFPARVRVIIDGEEREGCGRGL